MCIRVNLFLICAVGLCCDQGSTSTPSHGSRGNIGDVLSHYEILDLHQMTHSVSRRGLGDVSRDVSFDVLGKHFHLRLRPHSKIMAPGFRVVTVDESGRRSVQADVPHEYFHGYDLLDPKESKATVYFEDDRSMIATIETQQDTYTIEPSWRHIKGLGNHSMIAYRRSDLNLHDQPESSFCEGIKIERDEDSTRRKPLNRLDKQESTDRPRRATRDERIYTPRKNTCPLFLVADYRFFSVMGEGSVRRTTSYLLSLVDRVDQIYRTTVFSPGLIGMGFEVKEIRIHQSTSSRSTGDFYNTNRTWHTKELLEAFSEDTHNTQFCLGHLFTAIKFSGGTLGLSYVASPYYGDPGGVCSHQVYNKPGRRLYLNTGWSSAINRYNRRLLTEEALLVTTHEFGHNWGSEHDPDTVECSPTSSTGGKYIMYTFSVSGYDQNNKAFSNCSRRNIGAVLQAKANDCFEEESGSFCGNFRIDSGLNYREECDGGPLGREGHDPCCDDTCRLRPNAQCSDSNHACCENCRFKNKDVICHETQEDSCHGTSYCVGNNGTCPSPPIRDDNSSCINRGKCKSGECLSFCESEGLMSCVCDNADESCYWCCKDSAVSECKPHVNNWSLPVGTACIIGTCNNQGICEKTEVDLIERIWDIIGSITPQNFLKFMRVNIVGCVIILSLLMWIPASCIVCHLDRKRNKEDNCQRNWLRSDNNSLVLDEGSTKSGILLRRARGLRPRRLPHVIIPKEIIKAERRSSDI